MKKLLWFGVGLIVVLLVLSYYMVPAPLFDQARKAERRSAGLVKTEVQVDDHRIVYLEGGRGETVILLHGYGADKDNWTRFAKDLTPNYRLVIPDLAGFGESSKLPSAVYDIESQVSRLNRFLQTLKVERCHLVGNSMGGLIAAAYGAKYPRQVQSIGLIAPAGVTSPKKSEVILQMEKGVNPLLVGNEEDFDRLMALVFVKPPPIPGAFKRVLVAQAVSSRAFNEKIGNDLKKGSFTMEPYSSKIMAPVLIVWGDGDRILDVSGAAVLEKQLKNSRMVIMKETGHIPMLEKPAETAAAYVNFLKSPKKQQDGFKAERAVKGLKSAL